MPGPIDLRQLNRSSLQRQGLIERHSGSVSDVIGQLAGLQAQHANSPYVALWSRRAGQSIDDLESALTDKSVVKATLMRSTLHLVSAADFAVYDAATSPPRVDNWAPTARRAGVDLFELNSVLRQFCSEPRSVAEITEHLDDLHPQAFAGDHLPAGVRNVGFRMASAAGGLVHVPPSGLWKSHDKPRYMAVEHWLGAQPEPTPAEALAEAIERYLGAYGPATRSDIIKWVGARRVTPVNEALATLEDRLDRLEGPDGDEFIDLSGHHRPGDDAVPVRFLSRWDSLLIGYDDRQRILPDEYRPAVVKKNGDFLPTFLVDGFVTGLWSTGVDTGRATLRLESFPDLAASVRADLEAEGEALVRYVEAESDEFTIEWV